MPALSQVLNKLHGERNRIQQQLQRVEAAISALQGLNGRGGRMSGNRPKRTLSVAARRRIAAAQRARWAKVRAQKKAAA